MADIKWSSFPATTGTSPGDSLVGLHSGANERFLVSNTPSASGVALWDANSNLSANNTINGYATTVTAAGTTTLTVASKYQQYFTGSTTQTVVMPVTSTLVTGQSWLIVNNSSGNVTVNASDSSLILTMTPNTQAVITCISTSVTSNAGWNNQYVLQSLAPSQNQGGVIASGGATNSFYLSYSYSSYTIAGTFYPYLLSSSFAAVNPYGPSTFSLGNIQIISTISFNWKNLTTITGDNILICTGSMAWNAPLLTSVSFANLIYAGALTLTWTNSLTSLSMPNLVFLSNFTATSATSLQSISFPSLLVINNSGNLSISGTLPALTSFSMPLLAVLPGGITLTANALTTWSMPSLQYIGIAEDNLSGAFTPVANNLATLSMGSLISVNGAFNPTLPLLTSLTLTSLQAVTGAFGLTAASLTTLAMPALTTLGAGFAPVCAAATTVTLTSLSSITGTVAASFASLTTLSLPALTTVTSTFTITAANLVTFSMNTGLLNIGGNFTMTGMKLNQASVDGILVRLAALDGTGGTTSYNNRTVNLSGGTSSTPSATGLAAKATLQARGCTVTTN